MGFADVFAGYEKAAAEHHQNLLKMDYENKRSIAEQYIKMADDPRFDEETQAEARKRGMTVLTLEPGKKLPKEYETFMFQRKPATVQIPGVAGLTGGTKPQTETGTDSAPETLPENSSSPGTEQYITGKPQYAQAEIQPHTIQGPTPPPSNMFQPMAFGEHIRRATAESIAKGAGNYNIAELKAMQPTLFGPATTIQGPDGKRYKQLTFKVYNPQTGQSEFKTWTNPNPVSFFAPRNSPPVPGTEIADDFEQGLVPQPLDEHGNPMDINTLKQVGKLWMHIGESRYIPVGERKDLRDIDGYVTPYGAISGTKGAPVGLPQASLPKIREALVPRPGGKMGKVELTTRTQMPSFVPGTPIPPLGQSQPAVEPPSAAPSPEEQPYQGQPGEQKIITDDVVNRIMSLNRGISAATVREGLKNSGWTEPGQQPAAAAPVPPPQARPATPSARGVTPLPDAGRGLSAKEVQDGATRAGVLGTTIGRGANIMNMFDKIVSPKQLDSFLKRAQLQIVANPAGANKFSVFVANKSQLSPEEASFASDFASLGEDINVMRAITNATGFRGKEAFEVLLGQRGNLLGNPDVFKGILKNSLRTIITQIGPLNRQLLESGYQTPISQDIFNGYKVVYGPDRKAIEEALRQDGWVQ